MLKLSLRSIVSGKLRFLLTAMTVVLGVTLVVASFVLADSLRETFGQLSADVNKGKDFIVRGELAFGSRDDGDVPPVPEDLLAEIRGVDGVKSAEPEYFVVPTTPIKPDGDPIESFGPPIAGLNWTEDETLSQLYLIDGDKPVGPDEMALGIDTVKDNDFVVGETYTVITPNFGPREFTLTGSMQFGFPDNAGVGATFTIFDTDTAQEMLGQAGFYQEIWLNLEDGADPATVQTALDAVMPNGVEVATGAEVEAEFSDSFEGIIGPFQTILLVFAFIVLFVSAFIINNTFNIILGQRIKEMALLRAIGATGAQVTRSVLIEAVVVGIAAAAIGMGLGILGAMGLRAIFSAIGGDLPSGGFPVRARTVVFAVVVGIGFPLVASVVPAYKASKVPPIAALSDGYRLQVASLRRRLIVGLVITGLGVGLAGLGLFGSLDSTRNTLLSLGLGAGLVFIGASVLSPLIVKPVVGALGLPLPAVFGTTGRLARENAIRSPRRTSATAIALTIGLALVSLVTVIGASLKDSFAGQLDRAITADYIVTDSSEQGGVPRQLAADVGDLAEIQNVATIDFAQVQVQGDTREIVASPPAAVAEMVDFNATEGSIADLAPDEVAVYVDAADDLGVGMGDTLDLEFRTGDTRTFTVTALFDEVVLGNDLIIDGGVYDGIVAPQFDDFILARLVDGVTPEEGKVAIAAIEEQNPQARVEDQAEFLSRSEGELDTVLALVNVFLGFAIVIAVVGIVSTLLLSVIERTREIGLVRAVGGTRRQLRRMIRWEAVIVSIFGALLGVVLGVAFGAAIAYAIPSEVIESVTIPWFSLVIFVLLAGVAGLAAAVFPAFRASRLNILDAIAYE